MEDSQQTSGEITLSVVDANQTLTRSLQSAKAKFSELAPLIIPDRIHPSETGHWILASELMSTWHVNPIVSRVVLNAATAQPEDKERTTVTHLEKSIAGLKWTQLDEALPLPLDFNNAMTPVLLEISDIAKNRPADPEG